MELQYDSNAFSPPFPPCKVALFHSEIISEHSRLPLAWGSHLVEQPRTCCCSANTREHQPLHLVPPHRHTKTVTRNQKEPTHCLELSSHWLFFLYFSLFWRASLLRWMGEMTGKLDTGPQGGGSSSSSRHVYWKLGINSSPKSKSSSE